MKILDKDTFNISSSLGWTQSHNVIRTVGQDPAVECGFIGASHRARPVCVQHWILSMPAT